MEELSKYFIYATLLMPAIIMITIRRWITPINCKFFQDVFRFIGYGVFNFAVFALLSKFTPLNIQKVLFIGNINVMQYLFFTFIEPIILGLILAFIDKNELMERLFGLFGINIETNTLSSWEEVFALNPIDNITITLDNGDVIKGRYTDPSRISSSIEQKDLYLSKIYSINDNTENIPKSMWINGNNIINIAFETFVMPKKERLCIKIIKSLKLSIINILIKIYRGLGEINKKHWTLNRNVEEILKNTVKIENEISSIQSDVQNIKEVNNESQNS